MNPTLTPGESPRKSSNRRELQSIVPPNDDGSAAKSAAFRAEIDSIDADLRRVVEAWPTLPEPIRAGILAMVRAAAEGGGAR